MSGFSVSVVIPLFNKAPYIRRTLETVLAQTHAPDAVIIVDDGATDGSVAAIADLIGGPVRLVTQANAGPGAARNRGIAEAPSEWVALIDGDDLWAPDHLATLAEVHAEFPQADVVTSQIRRGRELELAAVGGPLGAQSIDYFAMPPGATGLSSSSAAVRRALLTERGFAAFWPGEDFELWTRLALDHRIAASSRCTALYTQDTGGLVEQGQQRANPDLKFEPVFVTLAAALADSRHADRHAAIRGFRNRYLASYVRQALYRGEPAMARKLTSMIDRDAVGSLGVLRVVSRVPRPVLRVLLAMRTALR